ncbi:MAG: DUF835 domain-containing protein, partial [Methanothrix sp.]|nr:DUF835 domain-containing protein [Methanothrix sp.]
MLEGIIRDGPLGVALLRPTDLLGLGLDVWTNSLFWTLFINCSLYVLVSLISIPSPEEEDIARGFVAAYQEGPRPVRMGREAIRLGTVEELEITLAHYIGEENARKMVDADLARLGTTRERIEARQLLELWSRFEKTLTGSVGSSATRMIVDGQVPVKPVVEAAAATRPVYDLRMGRIYIVPEKAYEVFTDQITHGVEGLCITHLEPEEVRRRWGFRETPIIKLSDEKGGDRYISPKNLPLLFMTIKSFVESSKNSIVLIDSIEQLVRENAGVVPEKDVVEFVYRMEVLASRTRLLLAERRGYVHTGLPEEINEVDELLFILGPLSAYLFKVFSDTILSRLSLEVREAAARDVNAHIAQGSFFEGISFRPEAEITPESLPEAACEPEMGEALRPGSALEIPQGLVLSR